MERYEILNMNLKKRATKINPHSSGLNSNDRLKTLNLPNLEIKRGRGRIIEVLKNIGGLYDQAFPNETFSP